MITKGIIKSIDLLGNTCTVHIPFFETAGNDPIIETATVSNTPGSYNGYKVGDVVYVAFEDGSMSTPVVIGKLYLGTEKEKADPRGVSNVEESAAAKKATLPADSKLTAEIDSNVPNTTVPYSSLSSIANGLNTLNTNVGQMDRDYGNRFKQVITDVEGNKSTLEQTAREIRQEVADETSNIRTEIKQTAEKMVAKVSGYETDTDGNPILDKPTEFGWNLQKDSWSVFNQDKPILTANAEGLHVKGQITAESGHLGKFIIGAEHPHKNDDGTTNPDLIESGIYTDNYIDCFKQTPGAAKDPTKPDGEKFGETGVYIGTDGIKLGEHFSVDPEGNMTASSLKISYTDSDGNDAIAADNIDDAVAQILSISKGYTDTTKTYITGDWIATTTVLANSLQVKSANINGQLTADKINTTGLVAEKIAVSDASGNNLLYADATKDAPIDKVKIGNFVVDTNSISLPTRKADGSVDKKFGVNNTVTICTGSDSTANIGGSGEVDGWNFTAGKNFGVRTIKTGTNAGESELYASKGKIGGFVVDANTLTSTSNNVGISSDTSSEALAFWAGGADKSSAKFYVTNAGDLKATSGSIGGCTINTDGKLEVPASNITGQLIAEQINAAGLTVSNGTITGGTLHIARTSSLKEVYIGNGAIYISGGKPQYAPTNLSSYNLPLLYFDSYTETGIKDKQCALYVKMVAETQGTGVDAVYTYMPSSLGVMVVSSYGAGGGEII